MFVELNNEREYNNDEYGRNMIINDNDNNYHYLFGVGVIVE